MARQKPQVHIYDTSDNALCVFSNGDIISGEISIHAERNMPYSDLVIMLEGVTTVSMQHELGTKVQSTQTFLRLRQQMRAEHPGNVPYTFVIPSALPTESCSHAVSDPLVRYAHTALPPSLGGKAPCDTGRKNADILTPNAVHVRYYIKATLQMCHQNIEPVLSTRREIYIIPTPSSDRPPPAFTLVPSDLDKVAQKEESIIETKIVRNILRQSEGRLAIETLQSDPLTVHLQRQRPVETIIPLRLRYHPASSGVCPRLHRLTTSIRALTSFGLSPSRDFCNRTVSRQSSVYVKALQITIQDLSSTTWEAVPCHTEKKSEAKERAYEALVPLSIVLPPDIPFVPSFDSCLVGRGYELEIVVYYRVGKESVFSRRIPTILPLAITMSSR
ncbi:hypothetical protein ASPBRDRAFT_113784 [Aspergillus brasiliensis CBS 101740]|uniref:Arrestin-like N-terminal domain-containing protein n=1 Tax=Aspergillus brasiliensis (strain CBS 101740 / IMI 381727 / IBT 21946) TaxID=767769 RepID=A0A1L9V2M6_ASPBC|nr:hypothetical protein ASPBRDRAFT_113784 [Aspergillus brasiliensis CBS 101740]